MMRGIMYGENKSVFLGAVLWLLFIGFVADYAIAQPSNRLPPSLSEIDQRVELITDPDSAASLYLMYSRSISHTSPEQIREIEKRLDTIERLDELKKVAFQSEMRAHYYQISEVDSSINYYDSAASYYRGVRNYEDYAFVRMRIARLFSRKNDYISAEEVYYNLLQTIEGVSEDASLVQNLRNEMAGLYVRVGATDLAIQEYEATLQNPKITSDLRCRLLLQISNAYKRNKQFEKAIDTLLECTNLLEESNDPRVVFPLQIAIWRSISDLHAQTADNVKQLDMALKAYDAEKNRGRASFPTMTTLLHAYLSNDYLEEIDFILTEMDKVPDLRIQQPNKALYFVYKADYLNRSGEAEQALSVADEALVYVQNLPANGGGIRTQILNQQAISYEILGRIKDALSVMKEINSLEKQNALTMAIQEENLAKVRFQIRAKNEQLDQISDQLTRTQATSWIFILVVMGGVGFLFYRNKKETELEVNKAKIRISEDLHDDLSANLNSISFYSNALMDGKVNGDKDRIIEQISEISTQSSERISDIIWATQITTNTVGDFTAKCKRYVLDLFETQDLELSLEIDTASNKIITSEQTYDLWLSFKEILNNIIKHSKATQVDIRFHYFEGNLCIRVHDNGVGFIHEELKRVFGLANIESRVKRIGGSSKLSTEPGEGTKWEIRVPL